jgi:serine/threonine protein kinase
VDADPHADPPWMVTAYIEGPSLQEAVGRDGPLPPVQVRALGAGLAEGLAAIHVRGLVHRDLKPGNVIMAADGPRIIDFGIARSVDASTAITTTGAVVGTLAYMSPEQIRGGVAGSASDVFSLGSVLGFAATGRPPFGSDSAVSIMFRVVNQPPDLAGVADSGLRELIADCLAKSPRDRPPVQVILAALGFPNCYGQTAVAVNGPAFEIEYAPNNVVSGLCMGVASIAVQGEGVTLQPCGVSAKTVWIADIFGSPTTPSTGYVPLINGSDTDFSQPFVLTYPQNGFPTDVPRPQLLVGKITGLSQGSPPEPKLGTVDGNQLWGANFSTG